MRRARSPSGFRATLGALCKVSARPTRRAFVQMPGVGPLAPLFAPALLAQAAPRVVVIGGGFAGATCAREVKRQLANATVILVEPNATFTACPFSNAVIAGLRDIDAQRFGYEGVKRAGIVVAQQAATAVDPQARRVTLTDSSTLDYDRLVLAPGIDLRFDALPGYDER